MPRLEKQLYYRSHVVQSGPVSIHIAVTKENNGWAVWQWGHVYLHDEDDPISCYFIPAHGHLPGGREEALTLAVELSTNAEYLTARYRSGQPVSDAELRAMLSQSIVPQKG